MFFHKFDKKMEEVKADIEANKDVTIVDVRFMDEYGEGHIPHAVLLELPNIETKAEHVLPDKNAALYVYCRSGQRSAKAKQKLQAMGYLHVYNIGGIIHWPYEVEK